MSSYYLFVTNTANCASYGNLYLKNSLWSLNASKMNRKRERINGRYTFNGHFCCNIFGVRDNLQSNKKKRICQPQAWLIVFADVQSPHVCWCLLTPQKPRHYYHAVTTPGWRIAWWCILIPCRSQLLGSLSCHRSVQLVWSIWGQLTAA